MSQFGVLFDFICQAQTGQASTCNGYIVFIGGQQVIQSFILEKIL